MNDTVDVFTTNAFALLTVIDEQAGNGCMVNKAE
jgi:hypothetical protein